MVLRGLFAGYVFGTILRRRSMQRAALRDSGTDVYNLKPGYSEPIHITLDTPGEVQYSMEVLDGPPVDLVVMDPSNYRYYTDGLECECYERGTVYCATDATVSLELPAGEYVVVLTQAPEGQPTARSIEDSRLEISYTIDAT
jgi:hypothetical protein